MFVIQRPGCPQKQPGQAVVSTCTVVTKTRGGSTTRAPSRAAAKKPASRARRPAPPPARPPFWRVQARDLWAVALITLGVLLALALWGRQLGPGRPRHRHGVRAAGRLGPLPAPARGRRRRRRAARRPRPAPGATTSATRATSRPPGRTRGASPSAPCSGSSACAGCSSWRSTRRSFSNSHGLKNAGGYLGAVVGRPLHAGLGTAGAAVLLVAVVLVALLIATGVSVASVGRALRTGTVAAGRAAGALWRGKPLVVLPENGASDDSGGGRPRRLPPPDVAEDDASDARRRRPSRRLGHRHPARPRARSLSRSPRARRRPPPSPAPRASGCCRPCSAC